MRGVGQAICSTLHALVFDVAKKMLICVDHYPLAPVNHKTQVRVSVCTAFTIECVENKLLTFPYLEIDQVFAHVFEACA